ncbi:MAG: hypothetical protein ACXACF_10910 [Candidatus Hermodarchaeia archaeon]
MAKFDATEIVGIVTSSITIVAFLLAVDYFTARPSLKISLFTTSHGFYMDSVIKYYRENAIEIPKQLYEDKALRGLFPKVAKSRDPNNEIMINAGASDELLIKLMSKSRDISWYLPHRIEMLENHIEKYTYKKRIYVSDDSRGFHDTNTFQPVLHRIKLLLSQEQYYIFLTALIRSREIPHQIFINNDGDIDLKKVEITVPAPVSKITESRSKNILGYEIQGELLHEITEDDDRITMSLQILKQGESFGLRIRTKENKIMEEDIITSYERAIDVDKNQVLLYCVCIFGGILLLRWICPSQPVKS